MSNIVKVYWLLLLMILYLPFSIWLYLELVGLGDFVWSLPPLLLGCSRSPGGSMALGTVISWDTCKLLQHISWETCSLGSVEREGETGQSAPKQVQTGKQMAFIHRGGDKSPASILLIIIGGETKIPHDKTKFKLYLLIQPLRGL